MTDYTGKLTEQAVSEFIVSTCQVLPKSCYVASDLLYTPVQSLRFGLSYYYWPCGSGAEFHIRPLNSCVDDIDELFSNPNMMVFTEDFPVLPDYAHYLAAIDSFQCLKIEPHLKYPGFVRLRYFGEMNYNWNYKKYEFSPVHLPHTCISIEMATILTESEF